MKKTTAPIPVLPRAKDSLLKIHSFGIDPEKHAQFQSAILASARAAIDAFPKNLEGLKEILRSTSPIDVLAVFASYGMQAGLTRTGDHQKLFPEIQQYDGEVLQAILLTIPRNEWGRRPITPQILQMLFDTVSDFSSSFMMRRVLEGEAGQGDAEAFVVRSLQERMRMHTQGVRNWGYYRKVVQTSRDLYAPLDPEMQARNEFSATDVLDTLEALVSEFENRQASHWGIFKNVLRGKTARKIADLYYRLVPGLAGTAAEMFESLPAVPTRDQMIGLVMGHYDLRLADTALFTSAEIAARLGKRVEVVSAVLEALSLTPGALVEANPEFLFLDNPVWERPVVKLGDMFFCPMPQMAFSHIHRIMDFLVNEAELRTKLKERRAEYLEGQLEAVFRRALPDAKIRSAVKWKKGSQQFENDLVVVMDRVILIAEAKSHRLTPQGLRGGKDRIKRHIREIILEPSIQSARLEELIHAARGGDETAVVTLAEIGINSDVVDRVIRISVTLDDLSVLSASERDFKKVGWVPDDHLFAPGILITDLDCLSEILDNPLLFLHYLSERTYLQKALSLLGDELDFLGLCLVSGFNLARLHDQDSNFSPTGMSGPIDRFYEGREAGLRIPKPKMELRPLFRDIVERLSQKKPPGWTLIGFHLLSSADPAEQRAIERNLSKLRDHVQRNFLDPKHTSTVVIRPPEKRKATILFYLFPKVLQIVHRRIMTQLASQAIATDDLEACVVFARCTENWGQAFESVLLLERNSSM